MNKKEKHASTCETGGEGNENETEVLKLIIMQCICEAPDGRYGKITEIHSQTKQLGFHIDDILLRTDKGFTVLIDNKTTLRINELPMLLTKAYLNFINPQLDQEKLLIRISMQSTINSIENLRKLLDRARDSQTLDRFKKSLTPKEKKLLEKYRTTLSENIALHNNNNAEQDFFRFLQHFFIVPIYIKTEGNPHACIANRMLGKYFTDTRKAQLEIINLAREMKKGQKYTRAELIQKFSDLLNLEFKNPSDLPRTEKAPFLKKVAFIGKWHRTQDEHLLTSYLNLDSYKKFLCEAEQLLDGALLNRNGEIYHTPEQNYLLSAFQNDFFFKEIEELCNFALVIFLKEDNISSKQLKEGVAKTLKFFYKHPIFFESKFCSTKNLVENVCSQVFQGLDGNRLYSLDAALPELAEINPNGFLLIIRGLAKNNFLTKFFYRGLWEAFSRISLTHFKDACLILTELSLKNSEAINVFSRILVTIPNNKLKDLLFSEKSEAVR